MEAMMGSLATEKEWRKGPWTGEEDKLLSEYVSLHGDGRWSSVAKFTGILLLLWFPYIMNIAPRTPKLLNDRSKIWECEKQGEGENADEYIHKGWTPLFVWIYLFIVFCQ